MATSYRERLYKRKNRSIIDSRYLYLFFERNSHDMITHDDDALLHECFMPIELCAGCGYSFPKGTGVTLDSKESLNDIFCSDSCAIRGKQ